MHEDSRREWYQVDSSACGAGLVRTKNIEPGGHRFVLHLIPGNGLPERLHVIRQRLTNKSYLTAKDREEPFIFLGSSHPKIQTGAVAPAAVLLERTQ